jgi:hypothetical protein
VFADAELDDAGGSVGFSCADDATSVTDANTAIAISMRLPCPTAGILLDHLAAANFGQAGSKFIHE